MTIDDQAHILQQMQAHLVANRGNTITDVVIHGFMAVLSIVTSERIVTEKAQDAPKE